jgi:hypothetical protein
VKPGTLTSTRSMAAMSARWSVWSPSFRRRLGRRLVCYVSEPLIVMALRIVVLAAIIVLGDRMERPASACAKPVRLIHRAAKFLSHPSGCSPGDAPV